MADQELVCRECGAAFVFTEAEQSYFQTQGFTNPPKRCLSCRARARKRSGRAGRGRRPQGHAPDVAIARGPGGTVSVVPAGPGAVPVSPEDPTRPAPTVAAAPDAARPPRPRRPAGPMHSATCSVCGVTTEVPFVPDGVRPVFCLPCLKRRTR